MAIARAFTIAGSDSGGGAGIQADLKTFQELHVFGMSAITAVTAQNTQGVQGIYPMSVEAVIRQIDSIAGDLGTDAVKTGMLFNSEIVSAVSERIRHYGWRKVVVDPVMIAKGGAPLLQDDAVRAVQTELLPVAYMATPNIPEAKVLAGLSITTMDSRKEAARRIHALGVNYVLIKGGHEEEAEELIDLLYDGQDFYDFAGSRISTRHTHGTGCTFAAAITSELAKGRSVLDAVHTAKAFIQAAIEFPLGLGQGHGPTNHWAYRDRREQGK